VAAALLAAALKQSNLAMVAARGLS
jgi:hypothetical protein